MLAVLFLTYRDPFANWSHDAKKELLVAVWQTHTALLALVVVLLAFLFQLISVRLAYETSLLPFLANRSRLRLILAINILFVLADLGCVVRPDSAVFGISAPGAAVLGFTVLVGSCLFLLSDTLQLLDPDTIDSNLVRMVRLEIRDELRGEQISLAADEIMATACAASSVEFSPFDIIRTERAILSNKSGTVVDVNLRKLALLAAGLNGRIQSGPSDWKARVMTGIDAVVTSGSSVLGRVVAIDDNPGNRALFQSVFKIRKDSL
jgi:hypothetical protein